MTRLACGLGVAMALIGGPAARADDAAVAAAVEPAEARIGDRIRYTLTIGCPEGWVPTPPAVGPTLGQRSADEPPADAAAPPAQPPGTPPAAAPEASAESAAADTLTVEGSGLEPPTTSGGRSTLQAWWDLAGYRTGRYTVPPETVACYGPSGRRIEAIAQPQSVHIRSVLPPDSQQLDIRGPKPPIRRWLWLILAAVALAAALAGLAWWLRSRLRTQPIRPPPSPHAVALAALAALRAEGLVASDPLLYYTRLSAIVRRYVEDRFGLRAPEMTTEEFLQAASQSAMLSLSHRQLMREFLEQADLVKFARYQPSLPEAEAAFEAARRFIEETRPAAETSSAAGSAQPQTAGTGRPPAAHRS